MPTLRRIESIEGGRATLDGGIRVPAERLPEGAEVGDRMHVQMPGETSELSEAFGLLQEGRQQGEGGNPLEEANELLSQPPQEEEQQRPRTYAEGLGEEQPDLMGPLRAARDFAVEAAPATAGSMVGGAIGSAAGPAGTLAGSMAGGAAGEFAGQQAGITEEDPLMVGIAAGGPLAGRAAGGGLRMLRRGIGAGLEKIPPVRAGRAAVASRRAKPEFESLGSRVLQKQRGLKSRNADELYTAARNSGARVSNSQLRNTRQAIRELEEEMQPFKGFTEAGQALRLVRGARRALQSQEGISFDNVLRAQQLVGSAVGRAERAAGVRLSASKKVFSALSNDIDTIARSSGQARRPARVAQAAAQRAKIEFSVRDFQGAVQRFSEPVPGEDAMSLKVGRMRRWFDGKTNPKSPNYDKNFVDGLGDDVSHIKNRLTEIDKVAQHSGSAAGPGSIVVRGITAGGGGFIGEALAGTPGAAAGALLGASGPETMTAIMMGRRTGRLLERAVRMGEGRVPAGRWQTLGQLAVQNVRPEAEEGEDSIFERGVGF